MARCDSCRFENREGALTCRRCGTRLGAQRLSDAPRGPAAAPLGPAKRARRAPGDAATVRGRLIAVLPNGQDDAVYWLEDHQVDIGRSEGDILIDDPQLAPRHARLNLTLGGALITPLDRRNGVYFRLRSAIELGDADYILLGRQVLRFEIVPPHEQRVRPAIEDGVVLFGTPSLPAWGRLRQLTASGLGRDLYHLARSEITLGREHGDLVFRDDEFLSRRHAQLTFLKEKPVLRDLGSSNGTYLRLHAPQVLVPGDMIRLGDQLLRFELG
jgi:pSer/pThr/pTyr-binding forkhead associated (FHA) protein